MRVGVAYVDVRVNMTQYKRDLASLVSQASTAADRVRSQFSRVADAEKKLGSTSTETAGNMDKITSSATKQKKSLLTLLPHVAAVTASYMAMRTVWRGILAGLGAGVQFEQRMSAVKAISRATEEEFAALGKTARQLAKDTIFTATQTAEALKYLAMAGFNAERSMAALPGVLNLALIGELDLGRATDIATDTLMAFGLEARDITRVVDVMVATITRSNTNIEMMGQSMKFAAPVAKALGYEIEEVSAMIGVLAQSGIKAGIAGRNLQQAFIRTQAAAQRLGLAIGSDLIDVLKAYNKLEEDLTKTHDKVIARETIKSKITKDFGLIALKSVLVLKENIKAYEELALMANLSAHEAEMAALIMQNNVDSAWKILKSVISEISISLFDEYAGGLKGFLQDIAFWFRENADNIKNWADGIIELVDSLISSFSLAKIAVEELYFSFFKKPPKDESTSWIDISLKGLRSIADLNYAMKHPDFKAPEMPEAEYETLTGFTSMKDWADYLDALHKAVEAHKQLNQEKERLNQLEALRQKAQLTKDIIMEGYAWEGLVSNVEDHGAAMRKAHAEVYNKLPENLKKIHDEYYKLQDIEEKTMLKLGKIAEVEPELAKAMVAEAVRIYKKGISEMESRKEKSEKDFRKFSEKTTQMQIKSEGDKYDVMDREALNWKNDQIALYESLSAKEKEIREKAGMGRVAIENEYTRRVTAINNDRLEAERKQNEKDRIKAENQRRKDLREELAAKRAMLSMQKDILSEMSKNDEGYYEQLATIRQKEYELDKAELKLKYINNKEYLEALEKLYKLKEENDERDRRIHEGGIIGGLTGAWEKFVDNITTVGEKTEIVFNDMADAVQNTLSDAFYRFFKGDLDSYSDLWNAFLESLLRSLVDSMAKMAQEWIIGDLLGGLGGLIGKGLSGFGFGTSAAKVATPPVITPVTYVHGGGVIGYDSIPMRNVLKSIFNGAPRLHSGLASDEYPAILQKGEVVLPRNFGNVFNLDHSKGSTDQGSGKIDSSMSDSNVAPITNKYDIKISAVDAKSFVDLLNQNPGAVLTNINRALEKNPSGRWKMRRMVN